MTKPEEVKILEFKCIPERLVYNSPEFKVYGVSVNSNLYPKVFISKYGTASIVGNFQELALGVEYIVKAEETSDKNGTSYKVLNIRREKPNTETAIRSFLEEILTHNQVDSLLAVYPNIVDKVMKGDISDIDFNTLKGIKEYTFNIIKDKIVENFKLADLVDEFQGVFNISILKRLYEKYPSIEKVREVIRENPYGCLCGLNGIGFKTADSLLLTIDKQSKKNISDGKKPILFFGFDLKTSYQRMESCITFILNENEGEGHTYIDVRSLKKQCELYAKEAISHLPVILKADNDIYFDKPTLRVCKKITFETEKQISEKIKQGISEKIKWGCECTKYDKIDNFTLTKDQCKVTQYICENNIVILNGFAGVGKSSSTKALINMLKDYNKSFLLLAPTGRAAKVLSSYANEQASTIHRGLGYMPPDNWSNNKECPLNYDIVVVDEFSMVDIFLFEHLLEAIDFRKTKLLLIGDDAQLPSVSAGNVLYDLLHSECIPTVTLNKVFRYGEGGLMTVATDTRNSKQYLDKTGEKLQAFGSDKSYVFYNIPQEKIVNTAISLYSKLLSQGYCKEDIGMLTSYNKGDYGSIVINQKIQSVINPRKDNGNYLKFGETEFRVNDIVMNVVNNYKAIKYNDGFIDDKDTTFIANGDTGRIIKIEDDALVIDYDGLIIFSPKNTLNTIRLAYCITVHKSQGSGYKVIILLTPKAHTYMLNSNLLYVGETRAKEKCIHLGNLNTVNSALKKKANFNRDTMLKDFLSM